MLHLPKGRMIILQVEKEAIDPVYSFLKSQKLHDLFIDPTEKEIVRYVFEWLESKYNFFHSFLNHQFVNKENILYRLWRNYSLMYIATRNFLQLLKAVNLFTS